VAVPTGCIIVDSNNNIKINTQGKIVTVPLYNNTKEVLAVASNGAHACIVYLSNSEENSTPAAK